MKKIYLFKMFLMAFVLMLLGGVNASAEELTVDFESATTAYTDWEFTNFASQQTSNDFTAHGGSSYFGTTGGKETGSLKTKNKISAPTSIVFYVSKQSKNTTSSTWKLQTSSDGSTWTDVKTQSASSMKKGTWVEVSQDLSLYNDVYIRIYYTGSTAVRCIDDVILTYETSSTPTKTTAVIFDFTANPNVWGIAPTTNNKESNTDERTDLVVDGVTLTTTSSTSADYNYKTCIFSSTSGIDLRVYKDGTLTFTAPEDYTISKIVFTGTVGLESNVGTLDSKVWTTTDGVNSVVFTRSATTYIQTAAITLVRSVENKTMVATDKEAYYSTFSCDRNVVFTEDVNVYAVNVTDGKLELTKLTTGDYKTTNSTTAIVTNGYYVPANTGVLIYATDENITYYTAATGQDHASLPNNQLVAATTNGKFEGVTGYKYYKLAYDDYENKTGLGFYYGAAGGAAFVVKKGLAYLAVPVNGSNPAAGYAFGGNGGDDTTGINGIENDNVNETQTIYNLQGQRVEKAGLRGIYIVNGKKVVLK